MFPISRGTVADQAVVPLAIPDVPKLLLQVTCFTPTLSLAVPLSVTEAAVVDIVAVEGEAIVSAGAVVSSEETRAMVTVLET